MSTDSFPNLISQRLQAAVKAVCDEASLPEGFTVDVVPATNPQFGDYQSNAALQLSKSLRQSPRDVAARLSEAFDAGDLCDPPTVAGPGFINFRLSATALAGRTAALLGDDRLGVSRTVHPKTIVIDFSAPNIAKPMHVGHIRSTILGDCLTRTARFLGHTVVTDNHIGDWGTQFGMVLWAWKNLRDDAALAADPVGELLRLYRVVNDQQKSDDSLRDTCKAELVKLQQGDPENLEIWRQCVSLSRGGLERIYEQLDITFDHWLGESAYNGALAPLVERLLAEGIATASDGAICIFSDGCGDPKSDPFLIFRDDAWQANPFLIRKSDGGFLYATTDLATVDHRLREFHADTLWYVVGAPQQSHFDQLFAVCRRRGITAELEFISFGSILGKDRKMLRTRSGETVQLADVLSEARERALKVIEEKNPGLDDDEKTDIARAIGIGSVKYAELSQHRMTDYVFDWDTMLSLKGNTAPYLINAYVRTRSIFRRLGTDFQRCGELVLTEPTERALALKLLQYGETVPGILTGFRPNLLCSYLFELASAYHGFFEECPVLRSEGAIRESRLALCELTGRVLRHGLGLLGIQTVERM